MIMISCIDDMRWQLVYARQLTGSARHETAARNCLDRALLREFVRIVRATAKLSMVNHRISRDDDNPVLS